jgi:hypothetical protein
LGLSGLASAAALALRVQAVPVGPAADPGKVDIGVVLAVRTPGTRISGADTLTLVRTVYDERGNPGTPTQEKLALALPPATTDQLRYEVYQRLALAPGRYELRLNATSASLDTSGTVYADLEVPDFAHRTVALSNIVLGRPRSPEDKDVLAGLFPIVPTTLRDFAPGDSLVAFTRVFQGTGRPPGTLKTSAQLISVSDEKVWEQAGEIRVEALDKSGSAPLQVAVPLDKLSRGSYLLSISAERADGAKSRADLVFRIR